jgi:hypothetical protein
MTDDLVVARTFPNIFEANIALSALQAAGIDAMIRRDDCEGLYPQLAVDGAAIIVRSEDLERATDVLTKEPGPAKERE